MASAIDAIAVDRHHFRVLRDAGTEVTHYQEAVAVFAEAARQLDVDAADLDQSIWAICGRRASEEYT